MRSMTQHERPDWDPLIDLVGVELVRWFMWMYAVELDDGTVVHAYKHTGTRHYLHLSTDGRAFAYVRRERYRLVDVRGALEIAFTGWEDVVPEPDAAALAAFEEVKRRAGSATADADSAQSPGRT
jgi:hypothetical protein